MKPSDILHNSDLTTESAVAAALALAHRDPNTARIAEVSGLPPFYVGPRGIQLESLERFAAIPHRPVVAVALDTARDLHSYVIAQTGRFPKGSAEVGISSVATRNTVIFANRQAMSLVAFLDYHHADSPRWLNHTASVSFKDSHQFSKWKAANNRKMTQEAFALFIDEVLNDFSTPTGADMLSFATCLEAQSDTIFKSATKLATGETAIVWTDGRKGDISTKIIEDFTIGIPIWQGGQPVQISAKLFHRIEDIKDASGNLTGQKALKFWFTLRHLDHIIDTLFAEEVAFLRTAFEGIAPIYAGTAPDTPNPFPLTAERD